MVDIIASPIVDKLIQFLQEGKKLFKGFHKEAKSLQQELELMKCLLKDAESRSEEDMSDTLKSWLRQVKEIADHIEDVLDEYDHHMTKPNIHHDQSALLGFFHRTICFVKPLKSRNKIAYEIQTIKAYLREIKSRGEVFGLTQLEQRLSSHNISITKHYDPRLRALFMMESEVVGISLAKDELIRNVAGGPSAHTVISLAGAGGIGKTTLAKIVYDKEEVQEHFDCHAWITVSRSYDMEDLLRIMTRQVQNFTQVATWECDTIEYLIRTLRQYLKNKVYLVVFDDVWDPHFWEIMKLALPSNDNGSRIIITTRNDAVADSWKETSCVLIQKLQLLSEEDAWDLFCKRAFQSTSGVDCPNELKESSLEIITKCKGLPLAISTIAGLLSTKGKTEFEWRRLLNNLRLGFVNNPHFSSTSEILNFSFHDLPYHLKCCFLYFGIFPEDYSIDKLRVCRMWVAEGFLKEEAEGMTSEEVAEEYLNELIQRNLVSLSRDGTCSVHDMMREIILPRFDNSFCQILDDKKSKFKGKCRRLSIYNSTRNVLESNEYTGVRSIFLFNINELGKNFLVLLFERFKLLKVLDLSDAPIDELPNEVGNLFHLKYLDVRNTKVKMLPKSIGKLHNLQTLILINSLVCELPMKIHRLRNLRHLLAYSATNMMEDTCASSTNSGVQKKRRIGNLRIVNNGVRIQKGIGCLEHLQTLKYVEAHPTNVGLMKELENLRQLREFRISKVTSEIGAVLFASIMKMTHLRLLEVCSINKDECLDLQPLSSPPPSLEYLLLEGRLKELPKWIPQLKWLQKLHLVGSSLAYDPLVSIHNLPNLAFLSVWGAYDGRELHFRGGGGFQKLKELWLGCLDELKEVKIDRGNMPLLERLRFKNNPQLNEVPSDIQHLTNLNCFEIINMPREFVLGMQPDSGQDYWKVKHIPLVRFFYPSKEHHTYYIYKLGDPAMVELLQV